MILKSLFVLSPLLFCIAALALAFHQCRRHRILRDVMDLEDMSWQALFITCGACSYSFTCVWMLGHVSRYFSQTSPHNLFSTSADGFILFVLLPLLLVAIIATFVAAIWCLGRLLMALITHLQSFQSSQN